MARGLLYSGIMTTEDLIGHVAAHGGVSVATAEHATFAVLAGIGGYLSEGQRELVAGELPPELATALRETATLARPLLEHVLVPGMSVGHGRELIASVCRVFVEELSTEAVELLRVHVPAIAMYLAEPAPDARYVRARPGSLAGGRPGSSHPISTSTRSAAHTDSVAASNPHGTTKLSSSPGSTQERDHDTIAEGAPHGRPLARTHH